jgi:putative Mg2+ transporter-C (MgtC) family protein
MDVTSHLAAPALAAITDAQGWKQVGELGLAFVLSSLIGIEREWRQKSAGLRTHTLVGLGAALFVIVSKYGFGDVLGNGVVLDPSRVAAQVVTGIGFIGGGLIFVRGDAVRGLTTAAMVWMTAAIGMACGAGLALLAVLATAAHFVVALAYPALAGALPRSRYVGFGVRVVYEDGRGILRDVLSECTASGFTIAQVTARQLERDMTGVPTVAVTLEVHGQPTADPLAAGLANMPGIVEVTATDLAAGGE